MADKKYSDKVLVRTLRAALSLTLPVFAGFAFTGIAYGILMHSIGFGPLWTFFTSFIVFAGSMQYVALTLLTEPFNPLYALIITLMVNARHIFYGLSMLERLKGTGKFKPYLIFAMCDESFSLLISAKVPDRVDKNLFMFFVEFLNRWYWIAGCVVGSLVGNVLPFNTNGLDFALTALFVVILTDQWMDKNNRPSALVGIGCSVICLVIFGPDRFLIPAMLLILAVFALLSKNFTERRTKA